MRILRIIGLILLVLIALYLVLCLVAPKKVDVTRSTTIDASQELVFSQVVDLKKWEDWSKWHQMDTTMKIIYGEETKGEGASYSWTGDPQKVGAGKMSIIEADPQTL